MNTPAATLDPDRPPIRYIKLGANNAWTKRAFSDDEMPFSYREVPHDMALRGDQKEIAGHMISLGKSQGVATNVARQVCEFYGLDRDAVWITFADGRMWWARAEEEVSWIGESDDYGPRIRRVRGSWLDCNPFGGVFHLSGLSTRLTKVASTQQTLCRVDAEDYVWRKITAQEEPLVKRALEAEAATLDAVAELIRMLHWADFETLIDLLIARSGWQRVSKLGGSMKDADILVEQPLTGEVAFVQVKSASNQSELDGYIGIFNSNPGWSRMIFACHSPAGMLETSQPDVMVWTGLQLARLVFRQGLFDWLIARTS